MRHSRKDYAQLLEKYNLTDHFHDCQDLPQQLKNRYGLSERISETLGIPMLVINGDLKQALLLRGAAKTKMRHLLNNWIR
jgi:hypothetical protein